MSAAQENRTSKKENGRHAIVIGGSIVGLMVAEMLSHHFGQVTVLERDDLPDDLTVRKGAPQAKHLHILLARGRQAIDEIYPGIGAEMIDQGAVAFDIGEKTAMMVRGQWIKREPLGIEMLSLSRVFLEHCVRQRTEANAKVQIWSGANVTNLLTDFSKTKVTGVQIEWRRFVTASGPTELTADFVIDASGRTSKTPKWLQTLGYDLPKETVVNPFLGYATRRYERPANFADDWCLMVVSSIPPINPRAGAIIQEEDGNWAVTLAGTAKQYPPTDEAGFLAFSKEMTSEFYAAIKDAKPLSSISGYQRTENRWHHYEKLNEFPGNYAVIGDAFCGFNPIYGHGMSVGAMSALALSDELNKMGDDLSQFGLTLHKRLAKITQPVWLLATSEDSRWPTTAGSANDTWLTRLNYWYVDKVLEATPNSFEVKKSFVEVNPIVETTNATI